MRNHQPSEHPFFHQLLATTLATLVVFTTAPVAWAAPQGERVVSGSASFARDGVLTQITAGNNAIIAYDSFDIAAAETVQFIQPDAAARVLNRIGNAHPTQIDGALLSNGRVYLVNSAGVYFGGTAVVDVGALYAAAGAIDDADFIARRDRFTQLGGSVVNLGSIAGDVVALLGADVANRGAISAPGGMIALVAGNEVVLVPLGGERVRVRVSGGPATGAATPGVLNAGSLDASAGEVQLAAGDFYSLAIQQSATGSIRAANTVIEGQGGGVVLVSGAIDATGAVGGNVALLGERVGVTNALIDASGTNGGGTILVGGDYQGAAGTRTSLATTVTSSGELRADALASGDGGKVVVWSDGDTRFSGTISARGGALGGNGGLAETSGKQNLAFDGDVDLGAANGLSGLLLLDPNNINIVDGVSAADDAAIGGADGTILFADGGVNNNFTISKTKLQTVTGNILLQASQDLTVAAGATLNLANQTTGETVTFTATDDIFINAAVTTGGGSLLLESNDDANNGGDISIAAAIDTNGGGVTLTGNVNSGGSNGGNVTIDAAVVTDGGNFVSNNNDFSVGAGGSIAAGAGDVTITADATAPGDIDIVGGISGDALTITAADAGSDVALPTLASLGSLDITGAGGITLNGNITTSGGQRYRSPVVIAADRTLASSGSGALRFDDTLDSDAGQTRDLTLNTGGVTTLADDVGSNDALDVLTTDDAGSLVIAANVTTIGSQSYADDTLSLAGTLTDTGAGIALGDETSDALTVTGTSTVDASGAAGTLTLTAAATLQANLTLDAGANDLTVAGAVNDGTGASSDLALNSSGLTTISGVIGATSAVESVTTNGAGTLALGANVTTSGGQTYNDAAITLAAVTLSDTGAGTLTVGNAGTDTLAVNGAATLANSGGGTLDLNATTTLNAGLTVSSGTNAVTLDGDIDGAQTLALTGSGAISVNGAVGSGTALTSVTSDDLGTLNLNGTVTTSGNQTYDDSTINIDSNTLTSTAGDIALGNAAGDAVNIIGAAATTIDTSTAGGQISLIGSTTLSNDLTLDSGAGALTVAGAIDGGSDLNLNSSALTTISGNLGATTRLAKLTTDAPGSLVVSGNVRTSGGQAYNETPTITLGAASGTNTLSDTHASGIQFAAGTLIVKGDVTLSTAGGASAINLTEAVSLEGDLTLEGGANAVTVTGALNDDASALTSSDVALNSSGTTTISTAVGAVNAITSLTSDNGGTVNLNAVVSTTAGQTYNDTTINIAAATLTSSGGGITIGNAASDTVNFNGGATTLIDTSAGGGQIALNASATLGDTVTGNDVTLSSGTGDITVGGDLEDDGVAATSSELVLNSTGLTTISGDLGGTLGAAALESVTTNVGGSVAVTGDVYTSGGQNYNETAATLGANSGTNTIEDSGLSGITFAATALTVRGDATLSQTAKAIDLTQATTLEGDLTLDGGANTVTVTGAVNDGAGASSELTLNSSAATTISTAIGAGSAIESVTTDNAGSLAINANVSTAGSQAYNDATITLAGVTLSDTGTGSLALGNAAGDALTVSGAATLANSGGGGAADVIDLNATTTLNAGLTLNGGTNGITIDGAVSGAQALALNSTGGLVDINAAINVASVVSDDGGTTRIDNSVTTSGGQNWNDSTIQLGATISDTGALGVTLGNAGTDALAITAASNVSTAAGTGDIDLNAATTLGGNTLTLNSGANDIALDGTVDNAGTLALQSSGATNVNAAIGGTTAVTSVTSDDAGTLALGANVRTTGGQAYDDAAIALAAVTLSDTGAGTLTVGNAGTDTLAVNGAANLTNSGGGAIDLNAATTLNAGLTVNGGANAVTLDGTIDGAQALALNGSGAISVNGAIGGGTALASVTSDDGGTINLNGNVTTTAGQTYNDDTINIGAVTLASSGGALTIGNASTDIANINGAAAIDTSVGGGQIALNASATLASDLTLNSGAGDLSVDGNLNGGANLVLQSSGVTTISGDLGGTTRLASVTTSAPGTVVVSGNVRTTGGQFYNETTAATLGATAGTNALSDTGASGIQFAATALTVKGGATLSTAGGSAALNLSQATTLEGNLTLDGGANAVTVSGALNDDANAGTSSDLALNSSGLTTISAAIGGGSAIESVTSDNAGSLAINANVSTTGSQAYNDAAITLAGVTLTDTGAGAIALGNAGSDTLAVNGAAVVTNSGSGGAADIIDLNTTTTLNAGLTLNGGANDIRIDGAMNGAQALALNSTGTVNINAALGATTALATLTSDDGGTLNVNSAVSTSGDLSLVDTTIDLGVSSLATTGAGNITVGNASTDTVLFSGATLLDSSAGTGDIALNASATLSADLTLNAGANDVVLAGNIEDDGAGGTSSDLVLNGTGATTISGTIGATNRVESVTTNAGGSLAVNADVRTSGQQLYQGTTISFGGTGARSLSGNGGITLGAAASNVTVNNDTTLSTAGGGADLVLAAATTLAANLTLDAGANDITTTGTISDDGNGGTSSDVVLTSSGATTIGGAITAETVLSDDAGTLALNANVTTSGGQIYHDGTIGLGAALLDSGTAGIQIGDAGDALNVTGTASISALAAAAGFMLIADLNDDFSAVNAGDLTISARSFTLGTPALTIATNIGAARPLQSLTLNTGPLATDTIEFTTANSISTTGLLSFNPLGRDPAVDATIFKKNGDLTLSSASGNVVFGSGDVLLPVEADKLTVAGDLTISAPLGQIHVGDINAVDVTLTAGTGVVVVGRFPGLTSNGDPDVGTDWVMNSLTLTAPSIVLVGQPTGLMRIGLPNGGTQGELVDPNALLAGSPFAALAAFKTPQIGLLPIDLVDQLTGVAIDFTPGGPAPGSQRPPHNPVAVLLQKPSGGVNIAAASERPLRDSEVTAFLSCDPEDFECQSEAVGKARANSAQAQELRSAFDDLFGPTGAADTTALAAAGEDPQRAVLGAAVNGYRAQTGQAPNGVAFRQFCQATPDHVGALKVLDDLRELFTSAREFGMTGEGMGNFKQQTLQAVAPDGIALDALDAAVEAGALTP